MMSTPVHWLVAMMVLWAGGTAGQTAPISPKPVDLNVLVRQIALQVHNDSELHGAWLFVELDNQGDPGVAPGLFTFRRVLDAGRAEKQRAKLSKLIEGWFPAGNYKIDSAADREYPFSELMAKMDRAMSVHPGLAGGRVRDGYYAPSTGDPDRLNLVLEGRAMSEAMVEKIELLASMLMRSDSRWVRKQGPPQPAKSDNPAATVPLEINPSTVRLQVVTPSESRAHWAFSQAMQRFWDKDYSAAAALFREATLESPRQVKYYYWQSLAELAAGQAASAYDRMYYVIRLSYLVPYSDTHREIIRSMERVQGPLRAELQDLEARVLAEVERAKRADAGR